ncbi:hypothetical protein HY642_05120 [Candidatus Woesearchaeota archaeon]|nr:hypothetical protein [Candidatus Woesearchaeota archaeon]
MSGGLDILIVGVAGKNLKNIAPATKLSRLFDSDDVDADAYVADFHALTNNPQTPSPRIFYLEDEILCGHQLGAGLGYVIFEGNFNSFPKKLDERIFSRVDELKARFISEVKAKGLKIPREQVGVYALNVVDT